LTTFLLAEASHPTDIVIPERREARAPVYLNS
jgi:hypothetical protein